MAPSLSLIHIYLVTKGRTALIKGFRSREDNPFDAYLTFDKDFRIVYGLSLIHI